MGTSFHSNVIGLLHNMQRLDGSLRNTKGKADVKMYVGTGGGTRKEKTKLGNRFNTWNCFGPSGEPEKNRPNAFHRGECFPIQWPSAMAQTESIRYCYGRTVAKMAINSLAENLILAHSWAATGSSIEKQ